MKQPPRSLSPSTPEGAPEGGGRPGATASATGSPSGTTARTDSRAIGELQRRHQQDEFRAALRALLMTPLLGSAHEALPLVRRHAQGLAEWFAREVGWVLQVERDGARLYKRPADLGDPTRGLTNFDRRRYVLLCLVCAVLERAEAQISLRTLGERLLQAAAEPTLAARGFAFALAGVQERRELVTVCKTLLEIGVLRRVAGDEETYAQGGVGDALYDVQRRALAGVLAAARGPSTWPADSAPVTLAERLASLVDEYVPAHEEGRRTHLRHQLARRLLDDPVLYLDSLEGETRAYFINQRGAMAARLCRETGLAAEQRAEGLALTDGSGELSDIAMPAEGTEAHATLLVAEHLSARERSGRGPASQDDVAAFLRDARERHGRFWRRSAREPGGEVELAAIAITRLQRLALVRREADRLIALPALARYALGKPIAIGPRPAATPSLFDGASR